MYSGKVKLWVKQWSVFKGVNMLLFVSTEAHAHWKWPVEVPKGFYCLMFESAVCLPQYISIDQQ